MRGRIAVVVLLACAAVPASSVGQASGPCAPGTPKAVVFDGLRDRIPYGPPEYFFLSEGSADWYPTGTITVRMADAATDKAFFHGTATVDDELFVELDLDDRPVVIAATYTQTDLAGTTCTQSVSRTVEGYRRLVLPPACDAGAYKPKRFLIACGDANFRLEHLRWRRWNRSVARARGKVLANDCIPFCAGGTFHSYPVKVRASRVRRCGSDTRRYRYTRLRLTYTGARPPGSPAREAVRVVCVS